jgi:hypothetical protein
MPIRLTLALLILGIATVSPVQAQELDGQTSGVALDASGLPVADQRIELRRPDGLRLVTTTDQDGRFMLAGLDRAGRYVVELYVGGRLVATSDSVELSSSQSEVSGVTLALPAPPPPPAAPPKDRRRVSADVLLNGMPVPETFEVLSEILTPGVEVIVRDDTGAKTRGWVSAVSAEELVVFYEARSWFGREPALRTFTMDSIGRIDAPDSPWNGALLGAAVGVGVAIWVYSAQSDDCNVPFLCPGPGLAELSAMSIAAIGGLIDRGIVDSPVYRRPGRPRAALMPIVGRSAMGASVRLRW